jgi:hypothetical protein
VPKGEWRLNLNETRGRGQRLTHVWILGLIGFTCLLCLPGDWLPEWIAGNGHGHGMGWGKLGHVFGYAALSGLACALPIATEAWLAALGLLSAHGFLTEFIQTFIPKRTGQLSDVGLDHIGIALGLSLAWLNGGRRERRVSAEQPDDDTAREDEDADLLRHGQPEEVGRRVVP